MAPVAHPSHTTWTCLHCGFRNVWEYDHWYTEVMGRKAFACGCSQCHKQTACQMTSPGVYRSLWRCDPLGKAFDSVLLISEELPWSP